MGILTSREACPECESTDQRRIRRSAWMRLIPDSKCYKCTDCGYRFVSSTLLQPFGFFLFGCGTFFIFLVFIADKVRIEFPGLGWAEKIVMVLGTVVLFLGAVMAFKK